MEITQRPSQSESTLAAGVNLAAIPFPYIGPIVGGIIGAKSKYIKFHAYRAIIEQVASTVLTGILIAISLGYTVYKSVNDGVVDSSGLHLDKIDWVALLIKSAATWVLFALWGIWNTVNSVLDALQAFRGVIPERPKWSERLAMKWSGLTNG